MLKKAVNNYFNCGFRKRVLILAIVIAILVGVIDLFALGSIQIWFPRQEVYSYFDQLATDVIKLKSIDFLKHLDDLDYLKNLEGLEDSEIPEIYESSNILDYYIVTEDSKANTIAVSLYGYHAAKLTLVVSRDYKLISLDKFCDHTFLLLVDALAMILAYCIIGAIISLILNLVLIGFQKIAEYCSRIHNYFISLRKNKKAKSKVETEPTLNADCEVVIEGKSQDQGDTGEDSEEFEEDDDYSAADYDTYDEM